MSDNMMYILKGRFKAMTTNTFGLFTIFVDGYTKSIESINVIASHFSSLYENAPDQAWDKFESKIKQLKWDGEISTNLSNDLQTLFVNSFLGDVVEQFLDCFQIKKFGKSEHMISTLIEKILADKNLTLQLENETISKEELAQKRNAVSEESKKQTEAATAASQPSQQESAFNVEDGGVILNVSLVLGPVHGIPVYDLRVGDQIVVKIAGRTQKEQYFIDLLRAKSENGDILPIKGIVKEIQSLNDGKEFKILIEIGPGVFGVASEQERVKLKRYDPLSDARVINSQQSTMQQQSGSNFDNSIGAFSGKSHNLIFIWIIGFVTLLLAVLFLIFFL